MQKTYSRGDMYYANLGKGVGSEQEGYRPVVIIQNNVGNRFSPTVIIAAISSKVGAKPRLPTHYFIDSEDGLELPSIILMEQLRTIDKHRLGKYIGHLRKQHIDGMNRALAVSIHLNPKQNHSITMCLCGICADNFRSTGAYILRKATPHQAEKDTCTYCNQRTGYDFEIIPKNI